MKIDAEEYKFAGIPTFMRSDYVYIDELNNYEVGVLGIPLDYGVSYREGTKNGPKMIREYSHWDRVNGEIYYDLNTEEELVSNKIKIADLGDLMLYPGDPEKNNKDIAETVTSIRKKVFPLILGGDHSITYSSVKGCLAGLNDDRLPLGVIHLDAHLDQEQSYLTLPRVWHGNPFRTLIQERIIDPNNLTTIGPRGLVPKKWIDFARKSGVNLYTMKNIKEEGLETIIEKVISNMNEKVRSVYVSCDIDCVDPAEAPGTGTP